MQHYPEQLQTKAYALDAQAKSVFELENADAWEMEAPLDRRCHVRYPVTVLHILEIHTFRELDVLDLSMRGMRVRHNGWRFTCGEKIVFDLIYRDRFIIKNARARVVRRDADSLGCLFENISPEVGAKLTRFAAATG